MQTKERFGAENGREELRRSVHDASAAIITVRALAEILSENLPQLVAISRSTLSSKQVDIPAEVLDTLPSIPAEMIKLCVRARESLESLERNSPPADYPEAYAAENAASTSSLSSIPTPTHPRSRGVRVLLVDDEATTRFVLSRKLEAEGCELTTASEGHGALKLLQDGNFDLVFMDLRLAGLSGGEVAKRLRVIDAARGRHTRLVGLTASPFLEDQLLAKADGMEDVLVKPIDKAKLLQVLRSVTA